MSKPIIKTTTQENEILSGMDSLAVPVKGQEKIGQTGQVLTDIAKAADITQAKPTEAPLHELSEKIREEHRAVIGAQESSLVHARNAGDYLALVRSRLEYKQ